MTERRQYQRSKSPQLLPVFDTQTQECVGRLVDLSLGGMLMMAVQPIPAHRIYQLKVKLSDQIEGMQAIEFGAESVWGDPPGQMGTCWAGFQVIDISDQNKERITKLLEFWEQQEQEEELQNVSSI